MQQTLSLNIHKIPEELRLILNLLSGKKMKEIQLNNPLNIDWEMFLTQAKHHRVYPLLASKISPAEDFIPSYVTQSIKELYKINTFQMLHLSAEMDQINKIFTANGISLLFLKGPLLGSELYGDISQRTSNDLDILIPIEQLNQVEELLLQQGYKKDDYFETFLNDWKWRHHHITFLHKEKGIKIEVHWRLNPGPGKEPKFSDLWERKRVVKHTNKPIYLLGKEDLFFFLVLHGARHGWSRLRWLIDIYQMLKKEMNWEEVYQLFYKFHHVHVAGQALILVSALFNYPLPKRVYMLFKNKRSHLLAQEAIYYLERRVNLHSYPVPSDVAKYHSKHLFSLMSTQQKVLFILSFLYPLPEDIKVLPLPKRLYFMYFPLRPITWLLKKTRKHVLT